MFRIFFIVIISSMMSFTVVAQELNCQISILTPQIQASDKTIYDNLQTELRNFLNNRKWSNDDFLNQERIDCSMIITISERVSTDEFKASIQIQTSSDRHLAHLLTLFQEGQHLGCSEIRKTKTSDRLVLHSRHVLEKQAPGIPIRQDRVVRGIALFDQPLMEERV